MENGWANITWGVIVLRDDPPLAVPPSDMGSHFGCLLDSAEGSDVSFLVGGEAFPAHRAVLAARSPVFEAQLLGAIADAKMPSITLRDVSAATFKVICSDSCTPMPCPKMTRRSAILRTTEVFPRSAGRGRPVRTGSVQAYPR